LEPEVAFWSELGGAYAAQVRHFRVSVTNLYLPFFVFGIKFTKLDLNLQLCSI
jgi:hypothetical protein